MDFTPPTPTPRRAALRRVRRLAVVILALAAVSAVVPATASAASCWRTLVDDYWADNRVDGTYALSCYRDAMNKLPRDVQEYSDAQDDLRRALLTAIRNQREDGGFEDEDEVIGAAGESPAPPGDEEASSGFFTEVLEKLGPKNADSIPVPLLVLGSIALLLVGAAGVSYGARYLQSRRLGEPLP
jgi:hypothetical protein